MRVKQTVDAELLIVGALAILMQPSVTPPHRPNRQVARHACRGALNEVIHRVSLALSVSCAQNQLCMGVLAHWLDVI